MAQKVTGATLVISERVEMDDGFVAAVPMVVHLDIDGEDLDSFLHNLTLIPQVYQVRLHGSLIKES